MSQHPISAGVPPEAAETIVSGPRSRTTPTEILITGGAGAIGSALSRWLVAHGERVVVLDVAPRADVPDAAIENVRGDVCDAATVDRLVARSRAVVHLASPTDAEVGRSPRRRVEVDVLGTHHVLASCLAHDRPVAIAGARSASQRVALQHAHALGIEGLRFAIFHGADRDGGIDALGELVMALETSPALWRREHQLARAAGSAIPWIRPQLDPDDALLETYRAALASGWVTNDGPLLRRFEERVAAWMRVPAVVAVSTGADALLLTLRALGLRGRAVLPSFTYIATLAAITENELEPVFCDVEPDGWTLDPNALARILAAHHDIAVVVPVNVFGVPPSLDVIAGHARAHGATLVYDNAHGIGTEVETKRVPDAPLAQAFSLHATKTLPAIEGGLVVGAAEVLAEVRRLRVHGLRADVLRSTPGFNAKMDELRAATGLHSLARLDASLERRRSYAERIRLRLAEHADVWRMQAVPAGVRSSFQNLGVCHRGGANVDAIVAAFRRHRVEVRRYFYPPLHRLDRFASDAAVLPVTDSIAASVFCLPLHASMSEDDLSSIESAITHVARELAHAG